MMKMIIEKLKNFICNNLLLKALSVILAVILWLLVINIDDPQTTTTIKNVRVTIINEEVILDNDEVYDVVSGEMINVKVTGPRTIVDSLDADDFTATADFSELSKTSAVPIDVFVNNTRYESKIQILGKSENVMKLNVEEVIEQEYPVTVEYSSNPAENYIVYKTTPSIAAVKVRAPKSVHKKISKIASIISLTGKETDDFEVNGTLFAYDSENKMINSEGNHITFEESMITVKGVVYYKKNVEIDYELVDNLSGNRFLVDYEVNFKTLDIVGKKEVVDTVEKITIPSQHLVLTDEVTEFEIDLKTFLPEGVYVYGNDGILKLKATTDDTVVKSYSIATEDIGIKKIPEGFEASLPESIEILISVKGERDVMETLNVDELLAYIELTNCVKGDNIVNVKITLPDGCELTNNPKVTVTLTEKKSEESSEHQENNATTTTSQTTTMAPTESETTTKEQTEKTTEEETQVQNVLNQDRR